MAIGYAVMLSKETSCDGSNCGHKKKIDDLTFSVNLLWKLPLKLYFPNDRMLLQNNNGKWFIMYFVLFFHVFVPFKRLEKKIGMPLQHSGVKI